MGPVGYLWLLIGASPPTKDQVYRGSPRQVENCLLPLGENKHMGVVKIAADHTRREAL